MQGSPHIDLLNARRPPIEHLLDRLMDICPFPAAAQRLMRLTQDERASIEAIAEVVACDPALAAQVLRISNSAAFRRSRAAPVRDLRRALVTIGLGELRMLSGALALLSTFATRDELSLDLHAMSVVSGSIAVAVMQEASSEERGAAFISGLLCEIGSLVCMAIDGAAYREIWSRTLGAGPGACSGASGPPGWPRAAAARDALEHHRYGMTTRTMGARLLHRHRFPQEIVFAVEAESTQSPTDPLLHRAVAFARLATPCVLAAPSGDSLDAAVLEIARSTSLVAAAGELVPRCRGAAGHAEGRLRAARE